MDTSKIEQAAKDAAIRFQRTTGSDDMVKIIAKAVAAAIAEYDRQKSE